MQFNDIAAAYDQAKAKIMAIIDEDVPTTTEEEDVVDWVNFCIAADELCNAAVSVINEQLEELNALQDIHLKWRKMIKQQHVDETLIKVLCEELEDQKAKLAAVDSIVVSYYNYIENDLVTDADEPFMPTDEQVQTILDAQVRLDKIAYEAAMDALDQIQFTPPDGVDLLGNATLGAPWPT